MLLSRLLADFTRGESDALRKAMGKKLRDKLDHMKPKFIEGGKKNGHDPQILEKIWGYEFSGATRTVDVHIRTLRQKLGESGFLIETVRGVGYRIGDKE